MTHSRHARLTILAAALSFAGAPTAQGAVAAHSPTANGSGERTLSGARVEPDAQAAADLERIRASERRLAPAVLRAAAIARAIAPRYRLPAGRLAVGEIGTMLAVESLVLDDEGAAPRVVRTDNGIHVALCAGPLRSYCALGSSVDPQAALPRRQALELAVRLFLETRATLLVASLPQSGTSSALLVVERSELEADVDLRRLRHDLGHTRASPAAAARIERLTAERLFVPIGLAAASATQDALVARQRPYRASPATA